MVMKRIESPINPVQGISSALLQFRDPLLGGRKLRPKPHILCPDVTINGELPGRLYIISPLNLRGVAYSHGLSNALSGDTIDTRITKSRPSKLRAYRKRRQ